MAQLDPIQVNVDVDICVGEFSSTIGTMCLETFGKETLTKILEKMKFLSDSEKNLALYGLRVGSRFDLFTLKV